MFEVKNNMIILTRGDVCALKIDITDVENKPYTLQSGDTLTFTMRKKVGSTAVIIEKDFEENILNLTSDDTLGLDFGQYVYDVVLTIATGEVFTIIPTSTFIVAKEVHN